MAEALISQFKASLPSEILNLVEDHLQKLENGDYEGVLRSADARILLGQEEEAESENVKLEQFSCWNDFIFRRLGILLADRSKPEKQAIFFSIGYAALLAFVQSNVTGPPLAFEPGAVLFPGDVATDPKRQKGIRQELLTSLSVDGIAPYRLVPHLELLALADAILTCPVIVKGLAVAKWAKLRACFMHQKLLPEISTTLQNLIYDDLDSVEADLMTRHGHIDVEFLLERAAIHLHHGLDKLAQSDLEKAKAERHFEFALTGLLGKRTKYQENAVSQLVVLAVSHSKDSDTSGSNETIKSNSDAPTQPAKLELNDDTLLESIAFSENSQVKPSTELQDHDHLSPALKALDPSNQPQLDPLDSTILLTWASSITNTSPQNGLTREETLPYATRVLDGGSSTWQVYTQALLVRSRIEGYKPRTVERGLLQLQALVDQVIADTTGSPSMISSDNQEASTQSSTFLPRAKASESAQAPERLRYVFQLATPTRWELEVELASRWVQLGGLRSALDIYERLEMWAEAALCWAATEREDKAKNVVRRQLFHATNGGPGQSEDDIAEDEEWRGPPREPPPLDAPRLYCILGDIDQSVEMYEQAWKVSSERYARAQRSIGRYYIKRNDFLHAAEAYAKSLKVNQLNHSSWFALGCALLELSQFKRAVEAFSRCVQLYETDAEAWSNLGAAILRTEPDSDSTAIADVAVSTKLDDEDDAELPSKTLDHRQNIRVDALRALKRAATLKHDSHRIWENVLVVAASLSPPDNNAIISAQKRIIDLRGPTDGEKCLDVDILEKLILEITSSSDRYDPAQPGLVRMAVKFFDESVVPLITGSARLWQLVSRLALWRNRPSTALDAEEKAWRAVTSQPGWETQTEDRWNVVVEATVRLCDSYESLGPKERTEGLGAGEPVMKDWRFKARSAVRGIMGRGKESWDGTEGWERLKEVTEGLKG